MKHAVFIIKGLEKNIIPTLHQLAFTDAGITWEFWGSKYISRHSSTIHSPPPKFGEIEVKAITKDLLDTVLPKLKNTCFIFEYSLERKNRFFLKKLKQYNIPYIVIINRTSFIHKELFYNKKIGIKNGTLKMLTNIFYSPINRMVNNHYSSLPRPILAILGTKNDLIAYNYPYPKNGLTYFHNENYEKLLNTPQPITNNNILVFVDQYLPWHPDTKVFDKWNMNAEVYYTKIASFLMELGVKLKLKPVIAAHPKTTENIIEPYLRGIPLIYGRTPDLIASAGLVVQHSSLTIEQAILMEKPLLLVMCNEITNSPIEQAIKIFADNLNGAYLTIENFLSSDLSNNEINSYIINHKNQFRNYIRKNIKDTNSKNSSYWKFIAQTIKNTNS